MENIAITNFPTYPERARGSDIKTLDNIPLFDEYELSRAADSFQSTKTHVFMAMASICRSHSLTCYIAGYIEPEECI